MSSYKPPYTITSKMVNLISAISEEITRIEYNKKEIITPQLQKKNRVKTLAGTLEIEGNFLGEEKITAIIEGKRVLGTYQEILEVEGAINTYREFEYYNYDSLDDLLKAHKILMKDILKTAGSFRSVNVGVGNKVGNRVGNKVGNNLTENQVEIIENIRLNSKISAVKLSEKVGISKRKIEENLAKLKALNVIKRVGGTRGYWEVLH